MDTEPNIIIRKKGDYIIKKGEVLFIFIFIVFSLKYIVSFNMLFSYKRKSKKRRCKRNKNNSNYRKSNILWLYFINVRYSSVF